MNSGKTPLFFPEFKMAAYCYYELSPPRMESTQNKKPFFFLFNRYHEFGRMYEDKHTPLLSANLTAEPMILSQVVSRTHYTTVPRLHPLHCSHVDIADYEFWAAIFILLTVKKIHINLLFF